MFYGERNFDILNNYSLENYRNKIGWYRSQPEKSYLNWVLHNSGKNNKIHLVGKNQMSKKAVLKGK